MMTVKLYYDSEWLITSEAYDIYKSCMYKPVYEKYLQKTRDFAEDDNIYVFVCISENQNVGILVMRINEDSDGEIIGIAVKPEYRRMGAGSLLIEKSAKMMNIRKFTAQTDDDTVMFYRALGFDCDTESVRFPDGVRTRYNCKKAVR